MQLELAGHLVKVLELRLEGGVEEVEGGASGGCGKGKEWRAS
jgi:hypothetical protein